MNLDDERGQERSERRPGQSWARRRSSSLAATMLAGYAALILWFTLIALPTAEPEPNVVPFRAIQRFYEKGGREFVFNVLGNLVVFLPLGILVPMARSESTSALRVLLTAALFSGAIELSQLASGRRVADIDDVLLNVAGALGGYAIYRWGGSAHRAGFDHRDNVP